MFGAIGAILWGDKMGRKTTIMLGMVIMVIGTIIMTSSYGLAQFIVGRSESHISPSS
jgi:MFS family permease